MNRKRMWLALGLVAVMALVAACSSTPPSNGGDAPAKTYEMRIGNATANDTQAAANDKLGELVEEYSEGRIKASVSHGESLGTNAAMIKSLQAGSVHGMILPAGFASSTVPELGVFDMPFSLPPVPAKITAFAKESEAAKKMIAAAAEKGITVAGFHGIGAQSFLTKFPINTVEDLKGKKLRIIPSPPRVGAHADWGTVARPMEFSEVYTALQQGTLDGLENPPDVLFQMKMHEVTDYYTVSEHFAFASMLMLSSEWLKTLPQDLQDIVMKAAADTIVWADEAYTESQQTSYDAMCKQITCTKLPDAEREKLKEMALNGVWVRMKADPKVGELVTLLEEDVKRWGNK